MATIRDQRSLEEALEDAWTLMAAGGLAPKTIADYRDKMRLFTRFLARETGAAPIVGDFRLERAVEFALLRRHRGTLSRSTLRSDAMNLRGVSLWLQRSGVTREHRLAQLPTPRGSSDDGRVLDEEELEVLAAAARGLTWTARRTRAMLAVLLDAGVRVSELVALDTTDVDLRTGVVAVTYPAKGGPKRRAVLGRDAQQLLRDALGPQPAPGPLFASTAGGTGRLTTGAVRSLLQRLSERADVERVSPHDFRRTGSTHTLVNGLDRDLHAALYGWRTDNASSRGRYLILSDAQLAAVVGPYLPVDRLGLFARRPRRR
ncbi:MAG: tyrosine-type recombinase/integrase [Chloroflexota bacterium]